MSDHGVESLRRLLASATPRPWTTEKPSLCGEVGIRSAQRTDGVGIAWNGQADAALIVAAVNALPALLAAVEAAREYVEKAGAHAAANLAACAARGRVSENSIDNTRAVRDRAERAEEDARLDSNDAFAALDAALRALDASKETA